MASKTSQQLDELARYSGDPWTPGNAYFKHAEPYIEQSWNKLIWPCIKDCSFERVIDLAAGHGRNSTKLAGISNAILILDIQPGNVEACRQRFAGDTRFSFAVNNGYDLRPAEDSAYSLVYCFDAMVHFHRDVIGAYLIDTLRVLRPGGCGFFHHSNYTGGDDWRTNPSSRAFMSAEIFAQLAKDAGLEILRQKVLPWGNHRDLDCITLVRKPL